MFSLFLVVFLRFFGRGFCFSALLFCSVEIFTKVFIASPLTSKSSRIADLDSEYVELRVATLSVLFGSVALVTVLDGSLATALVKASFATCF